MDLRKEVERLIYWYVPIILVTLVLGFIIAGYIKSSNDTSSMIVWGYTSINMFINHLHHIVVAVWLYTLSKKLNQKYVLWALFGLVAHLFAAAIFIVLYVYEKNELDSRSSREWRDGLKWFYDDERNNPHQ